MIFFKSGLRNILPITTAKVPIVKFEHRRSGLEGDISLYNTLVSFSFCIDPGMFTCHFKSSQIIDYIFMFETLNVSCIRKKYFINHLDISFRLKISFCLTHLQVF